MPCSTFAVLVVLGLVKYSVHLSQDVIWIIVILLFPVPGTVLYLLLGANILTSPTTSFLRLFAPLM